MTTNSSRRKFIYFLLITLILLSFAFLALVGYRLISGQSLGLRSFAENQIHAIKSRMLAISDHASIIAEDNGDYTNIIFLHHSTGRNLIDQGKVRKLLSESGYQFWDHDYNYIGLRDPSGLYTGYSYFVPGDNTDPDGLYKIFGQKSFEQPLNTFSALLQHEVVVVKSCFPASNISNVEELEQRKSWYLGMRDSMDQHPDKVFILLTSPPLNPAETTAEAAMQMCLYSIFSIYWPRMIQMQQISTCCVRNIGMERTLTQIKLRTKQLAQ